MIQGAEAHIAALPLSMCLTEHKPALGTPSVAAAGATGCSIYEEVKIHAVLLASPGQQSGNWGDNRAVFVLISKPGFQHSHLWEYDII